MRHLKGFGLENFRVFKEHTWFDFAPITLLVGPNSSGKSSLTKGLWAFKNIKEGDLSLKKDEEFLQLGNIERVFNNKSNSNVLKFSEAVSLKNYPTFGENSDIKLFSEYSSADNGTDISLSKIFLTLDDSLLYEIDYKNKKARLNIELFNKNLFVDKKKIKVKGDKIVDIEQHREVDLDELALRQIGDYVDEEARLNIELYGKYLFVDEKRIKVQDGKIIDIEQPRENLDDMLSGQVTFGKEIFADNKLDLEEVLKIYSDKKELMDEFIEIQLVETVAELSQIGDEEDNFTYADEYVQEVWRPLKKLLLRAGYNNNQAKYIIDYIFGIAHVYAPFNSNHEDLHKMASPIILEYHSGIKSNIQRIYRRIENDSFNNLLSTFFEKDIRDSHKEFLKKASEMFNLQGEINPILDKKYDTQTLEVNGLLLVEQGFGISQIVALLLKIVTIQRLGHMGSMSNTLICEEPEANLHPGFQSKLADMFVDAQKTFRHQFIIETHSEYMIRKFQCLVAKGEMKKEDIVIYYFNDPNNIPAGEKQVKKIEILEDGSLSDDFGSGFFDEASNWELELLRMKRNKTRQNL